MGPTASGKTDLAMRLVDRLPLEIISVDSALVYRGMNIGTAKPIREELASYPHRLIDLCDFEQSYSAGDFAQDAVREISTIVKDNKVPILVGGTMLYFRQLLHGMADLPQANLTVRSALVKEFETIGLAGMYAKLLEIDPVSAKKIKPTDPQRIQRALEVFQLTGKPISYFHEQAQSSVLSQYKVVQIGLLPEDRKWLHDRIAQRFNVMLDAGFLEEAKQFYNHPSFCADLPAMRMVGYRQAWAYFDGHINFDTMKDKAIAATRQLAKRQMTWLRHWAGIKIFDPKDEDLLDKVFSLVVDNVGD